MHNLGRKTLLSVLVAWLAAAGCDDGADLAQWDSGGGTDTECVGEGCAVDCSGDTDGDGKNNCVDPCPEDNPDDSDGDGVCESVDLCEGDDASGDYNANGVCDDRDWPSSPVCDGDGVLEDPGTGLCWQNPDYHLPYSRKWSYAQAAAYCADLELDSHVDWRLPTISELRSIIENCPVQETGGACGLTDTCLESATCDGGSCTYCTVGGEYLASFLSTESGSPSVFSTSQDPLTGEYYVVEFASGYIRAVEILHTTTDVRCVRTPGQPCGDADGDGVCDAVDLCPGEDDRVNEDDDELPDCLDECQQDAHKVAPGACGCGESDADNDLDGTPGCQDACDKDPAKLEPGACGCGQEDVLEDGDSDGVWDCVDPCPVHNPDDPDGDGLCGTATNYCMGIGDVDGDHVCDPDDVCAGDDKYGDADGDGICDHQDLCKGDDTTGDADGDYICDDLDECDGFDAYGDWDDDGICDNIDTDCPGDPLKDNDGDGICAGNDRCDEPGWGEDEDFDGRCANDDGCLNDYFNDQDGDGLCTSADPCPLDYDNDADYDGLCANSDYCLGDNTTGDNDQDGYCDDADICIGFDPLGDADGDGLCDTHECLPTPPFYNQQSSEVSLAAGGACVELYKEAGPMACAEADHAKFEQDIQKIMDDYPFTQVVFQGHNPGTQLFARNPFMLTCSFGNKRQVALQAMFDDINGCYHGRTVWNLDHTRSTIEFDWGVNIWVLLDIYNERAALFGGFCEMDSAVGAATGFHATSEDYGWITWDVLAKSYCDYDGCRCDATFNGLVSPDSTEIYSVSTTNDSCYNAGNCDPNEFPDWETHHCENPEFYF